MNIFGTNVNKKGKIEKNQKVKEGPCIFPFKHQWKEYEECIDNDDKGKICATSVSDRGTLKTYGYCTVREKLSIKSPQKSSKSTPRSKTISKTHSKTHSKSSLNNSIEKSTKKKALTKRRKIKIMNRFTSKSKSKSPHSNNRNIHITPEKPSTPIRISRETSNDNDIKIEPKGKSMNKQLIDVME